MSSSEELIWKVQESLFNNPNYLAEELVAVTRIMTEHSLMRDMIRLAKQRADATNPAHAWNYLVAALELDTDTPLVDLSTTTESSEK